MARPVTLFTGQWADMPLETLAEKASEWGYDGLELACWGDHFEVGKALADDGYCQGRHDLLAKYGLKVWAISNHLVGQAVCDLIDERHEAILPPHIWGDGDPEGVRTRAAAELANTARAAARLGVSVVNGFTGSSIWHLLYSFPPKAKGHFRKRRGRHTASSSAQAGFLCCIGGVGRGRGRPRRKKLPPVVQYNKRTPRQAA